LPNLIRDLKRSSDEIALSKKGTRRQHAPDGLGTAEGSSIKAARGPKGIGRGLDV
jgi:hypothetical protein